MRQGADILMCGGNIPGSEERTWSQTSQTTNMPIPFATSETIKGCAYQRSSINRQPCGHIWNMN